MCIHKHTLTAVRHKDHVGPEAAVPAVALVGLDCQLVVRNSRDGLEKLDLCTEGRQGRDIMEERGRQHILNTTRPQSGGGSLSRNFSSREAPHRLKRFLKSAREGGG